MKNMNSGQFMLEVIVAVGVIVLLATGLVTATTASLRSNQKSRMKNEAVRYVEDGMELVRNERDTNPSTFFTRGSGTYCLGTGIGDTPTCTTPNVGTDYIRTVIIAPNGSGKDATVTVSWSEGTITTSTQTMSTFTPWKTPTAYTPTITPSVAPTPVIIMNSASGRTCAQICAPKSVVSCGTDAAGSDSKYYKTAAGGICIHPSAGSNCDSLLMSNVSKVCPIGGGGQAAMWTRCSCL